MRDVRLLDRLELAADGTPLELVSAETRGADRQDFSYVLRGLGDRIPDPTVTLDRHRRLRPEGMTERLVLSSAAQEPVEVLLHLCVGSDLAPMAQVKQGEGLAPAAAQDVPGGLAWAREGVDVRLRADPAPEVADGVLSWRFGLERGGRAVVDVDATARVDGAFDHGGPAAFHDVIGLDTPAVGLAATVEQSAADLEGLLLSDAGDRFLAAGSPWFLTLFGRDSLWAARMLVPFDTGLALSTLRVLARRQGERDDVATEEEPGKILHEVRNAVLDLGDQVLPPVYYGSVDATPLFVCTLADAHDWGADPEQVRELLPAARRCLEWLVAASTPTGWLRYVDHTGRGLANQGWKDSHDSVQFADGRLAEPPIALSEVQAYAYEAAVRGAALLAAYSQEPVPGLLDWARDLRARFPGDFWVGTPEEGHLAIAVDGRGVPADSVTSNMGHVLGTGILDDARAGRVAALLAGPDLDSGFGLRTLSTGSPRFSRLSYHGGTVWPHDTAIAVRGLAAEGHPEEAGRLAAGIFRAAEAFGHRLPELHGGDSAADVTRPVAYPAACRPQAWSAAAPLAALVALAGLRPGDGGLTHLARTSSALGAWRLRGLRLGTAELEVEVDADGVVTVVQTAGRPVPIAAR